MRIASLYLTSFTLSSAPICSGMVSPDGPHPLEGPHPLKGSPAGDNSTVQMKGLNNMRD